jgi:hypothetical protein
MERKFLNRVGFAKIIAVILASFFPLISHAWKGYDFADACSVEIEKGNLVRVGLDIEVLNDCSGDYITVEVMNIYRSSGMVVIEAVDVNTDEEVIYCMGKRKQPMRLLDEDSDY